ncbi:PepSY domain-containing protein [Streptomyces subrutilus]|uniref:PepSY domain-containing protein n=1 Tax=Streptomyces subrutilus TaxID=36818 RepID=UPI0033E5AD3C
MNPSRAAFTGRRRRLMAATTAAAALTLGLAAYGSGAAPRPDAASSPTTAPAGSAVAVAASFPAAPAGKALAERGGPASSRTDAVATAEKAVAGGRLTGVRLERDHGVAVWKAEVITAEPRMHHLTVDATTGAVREHRADRMPERVRPILNIPLDRLAAATVDREDAVRGALVRTGGGFVSELSLQGARTAPVWRLKVDEGPVRHAVDVDATTAKVTRYVRGTVGSPDAGRTGDRDRLTKEEVRRLSGDFGRDFHAWS